MPRYLQLLEELSCKVTHCSPVFPLDIEAFSAVLDSPDKYGFPWPEIISRVGLGAFSPVIFPLQRQEIEDGGSEM